MIALNSPTPIAAALVASTVVHGLLIWELGLPTQATLRSSGAAVPTIQVKLSAPDAAARSVSIRHSVPPPTSPERPPGRIEHHSKPSVTMQVRHNKQSPSERPPARVDTTVAERPKGETSDPTRTERVAGLTAPPSRRVEDVGGGMSAVPARTEDRKDSAAAEASTRSSESIAAGKSVAAKSDEERPWVVSLYTPSPEYPLLARRMGYEGVAVLDIHVDRKGRADQIKLHESSGYAILDQAALAVAGSWRFAVHGDYRDARLYWVKVPVKFRLRQG